MTVTTVLEKMSKVINSINSITKIIEGEAPDTGKVYGGVSVVDFEIPDKKFV